MTKCSKQLRIRLLVTSIVLAGPTSAAVAQSGGEFAFARAATVFAERINAFASKPDSECAERMFAPPVDTLLRQRTREAIGLYDRLLLIGSDDALATLPPRLLQHLPDLPAGIEYRLAHARLVLWDVHAESIIDVLPDVPW